MAIEHGLTVLSWFENLGDDERPPEYLWDDELGLEQWWASVEAKREDGMATSRGNTDHDPDDDSVPHMVENDQSRYLKQAMA